MSALPAPPPEPPGPSGAAPASRSPPAVLALLVVAATATLALVAGALLGQEGALPATFGPTDELPFTIRHPEEWHVFRVAGSEGTRVLAIRDLPGFPEAHRVLREEPEAFQGVFLEPPATSARVEVAELRARGADILSISSRRVDGRAARRIEYRIPGPDLPGARFLVYLIQVEGDDAYALVFFGAPGSYDPAMFDAVAASLRFEEERMAGPGP